MRSKENPEPCCVELLSVPGLLGDEECAIISDVYYILSVNMEILVFT